MFEQPLEGNQVVLRHRQNALLQQPLAAGLALSTAKGLFTGFACSRTTSDCQIHSTLNTREGAQTWRTGEAPIHTEVRHAAASLNTLMLDLLGDARAGQRTESLEEDTGPTVALVAGIQLRSFQ